MVICIAQVLSLLWRFVIEYATYLPDQVHTHLGVNVRLGQPIEQFQSLRSFAGAHRYAGVACSGGLDLLCCQVQALCDLGHGSIVILRHRPVVHPRVDHGRIQPPVAQQFLD